MNPKIRDPSLNTAKCIIEGHELDIKAAGSWVRVILWCSLGFVIVSSPLLSKYVLEMRKVATSTDECKRERKMGKKRNTKTLSKEAEKTKEEKRKKINTVKALYISCAVLFFVGLALLLSALVISFNEKAFCIGAILVSLIGYSIILTVVLGCITRGNSDYPFWDKKCCFFLPFVVVCANLTSYYFCWLVIGTMINPTWGLTVGLIVCSVIAAFMYAVYCYLQGDSDNPCEGCQIFLICVFGFLSVLLLVIIIIFAGQSYNSNETTDKVLKTILLYFLGAFGTWISWKKDAIHPNSFSGARPRTNQDDPKTSANAEDSNSQDDELEMDSLVRPRKT